MEVNSSPGLEGIEESTGVDVAEEIIKYLEITYLKASQVSLAETSLVN
jgi:ribosomal protein S6--L-glutamate ligase